MRKYIVCILGLALLCAPATMEAQQRKAATKTRTSKGVTKRTTQKKKTTTTTTPVAITVDDPLVVGGSVAFMGVPVKQSAAKIEQQLKEKGFVPKKENGFSFLSGTAYGVKVKVFVEEGQIVVREEKAYKKTPARSRIEAYKKAFEKNNTVKVTENTMTRNGDEDGNYLLQSESGGTVDLHYYNQDEVNFDSPFFDIVLTFRQD